MSKIVGIPANGPDLNDGISQHFGHCSHFVGFSIDDDNNIEKVFLFVNEGHSSCMEPVLNMKDKKVTDMIIGGIGGRPFLGFLQVGINLYKGESKKSIKENLDLLIKGKLEILGGPSCSHSESDDHKCGGH